MPRNGSEAAAQPVLTGGSQMGGRAAQKTGWAVLITLPLPFVSGILSMIIIRTLRKDIANYNKEDDIVRGLGWGGMGLERGGSLAVGL